MALIKCPDCGKEFSDQASACPNCGRPNTPMTDPLSQNREGSLNQRYRSPDSMPDKNSGLSIAALVLSILGCTFLIGAILAIIDLSKKDTSKKHGLSKAALIICGVWLIISVIGSFNSVKNPPSLSSSVTVEQESTVIEKTEVKKTAPEDTDKGLPEKTPPSDAETTQGTVPSETLPEGNAESVPDTAAKETVGQKNALRSAKSYLDFSAFSYNGLIGQLEYENYSHEDAVYAADNCGADWNEQAAKSAKSYLNFSAFSYDGLIKQLEYEGYTHEQAVYGADSCGADWNEQAAKSAESYLSFSFFSRDGLIDQLEYEGFTHDQAVYGAEANGY